MAYASVEWGTARMILGIQSISLSCDTVSDLLDDSMVQAGFQKTNTRPMVGARMQAIKSDY